MAYEQIVWSQFGEQLTRPWGYVKADCCLKSNSELNKTHLLLGKKSSSVLI